MPSAAARLLVVALVAAAGATAFGQSSPATIGGPLPPLFPADNWWNQDVSSAPLAPESAALIGFINNGGSRRLHPDFGGYSGEGHGIYGIPYVVVAGDQPKRQVQFYYPGESDGNGVPFYPIPDQAITQPSWIEGGPAGNQAPGGDRHMLIVDKDNKRLYELFDLGWDGSKWTAGSGAFFDLQANGRRPEGWTSADAAGLAILPGLVRYDEVYGAGEITHALRVTVRASNSFYVWPASHKAGNNASAPPMGTRMRLKASKDISGFPAPMQKIFRAMKKHGLIVADNGSDMYIGGAFDPRWDNDVLNPAFHALHASDFEVIQLGWRGTNGPAPPPCTDPGGARGFVVLGQRPWRGVGVDSAGGFALRTRARRGLRPWPDQHRLAAGRRAGGRLLGHGSGGTLLRARSRRVRLRNGAGVERDRPRRALGLRYAHRTRHAVVLPSRAHGVVGLGSGRERTVLRARGRLRAGRRRCRCPRHGPVAERRRRRAARHLLRARPRPQRLRPAGPGVERGRGCCSLTGLGTGGWGLGHSNSSCPAAVR